MFQQVLLGFVLYYVFLKILKVIIVRGYRSSVCLVGKTAIVTGGNEGMGFEMALDLASRGCKVIIADRANCEETKKKLIAWTHNPNIVIKHIDLASNQSIKSFAKEILETEERLDILINNAGTAGVYDMNNEDGLNKGMQINHFGPLLLTFLLIDLLKKSAPSRIVWLASCLSFTNNLTFNNLNPSTKPGIGTALSLYANSKLCNIITSNKFAEKLKGTGVTSNACCPGIVHTQIYKKAFSAAGIKTVLLIILEVLLLYPFGKKPSEGAQVPLYLALSNEVEGKTGGFYFECKKMRMPKKAKDKEFAEKIWKTSLQLIKISPEGYL